MKFLKVKKIRVWFIVACVLVAFLVIVNALAVTVFSTVIDSVLGGKRSVLDTENASGAVYEKTTSSKKQAKEQGDLLNEEICEEGFVLLKNSDNALPVSKQSKISVFGKNSEEILIQGSGSNGEGTVEDAVVSVSDMLLDAGFDCNEQLAQFYKDDSRSGSGRPAAPTIGTYVTELATGETEWSRYGDVTGSFSSYKDVALVVLSRLGGEGWDLPRNSSGHYLQLDENETRLIEEVKKAGFGKVIIVINSNSPMELGALEDDEGIDGIIWIGYPGASGLTALGRILSGEVNPSGRLVDTYERNFDENPAWINFSDNMGNGNAFSGGSGNRYFVDYEEDIYVGYRYWETRGFTDGEEWYSKSVVYPFGYGLSYSDFTWELVSVQTSDGKAVNTEKGTLADDTYTVKVKVTNNRDSEYSGRDVVQLYYTAPYNNGGIEKAHVVLADYAKTKLLAPGESDEVTLTFSAYGMSSYDCYDANKNGFCGYELEKGDYTIRLMQNAHEQVTSFTLNLDEDITYPEDPVTHTDITNLYTGNSDPTLDSDYHLGSRLSRTDWKGTWPQAATEEDKQLSEELNDTIKSLAPNNPNTYTEIPKTEVTIEDIEDGVDENGNTLYRAVMLKDLKGKDYDDPLWDVLLDRLSVREMAVLVGSGAFHSVAIDSIKKPLTNETDGPSGWVNFMLTDGTYYGTCKYASQPVLGSTWNKELAKRMGESVGEEGLWGADGKGNNLLYNGWYAPGANIHRSHFGGRTLEYYSEDPYLTGKMAANVIAGASSKGVYCYMKHFVLNEQEYKRDGVTTWATEQALREIYLKPFEIAVKESGNAASSEENGIVCMGIMTSFNRLGAKWTGGDYRLVTQILRNEWGFKGAVITDFNSNTPYMDGRQMAYAGNDLNLANLSSDMWSNPNPNNAGDVTALRNCAHNILYTVANSNALQYDVIGYLMPLWQEVMFIVDGVVAAALIAWGVAVFVVTYKKNKQ